MITFIVATRNQHKVQEIKSILGSNHLVLDTSVFPGAPEVKEDAPSFEGNATKKATALAQWLDQTTLTSASHLNHTFVVADDSGLEVDALNGAPGVHSARFAALDNADHSKGNSCDADNNRKLIKLLAEVPAEQRTARFRCAMAVAPVRPNSHLPAIKVFEGKCEGTLALAPQGAKGFGYDPLFIPTGYSHSFAELGEATKNQISHRAQAVKKMAEFFSAFKLG